MINKHACTRSRHATNDLDYFCKLEILVQNKNCFPKNMFFQNLFFQNFTKYKNKIFKQLLKHSVYGYDPLHKYGEISMFLTLRSKHDFYIVFNQNHIFQNENSFVKTKLSRVCVYIYLSNPPTTLSFTF